MQINIISNIVSFPALITLNLLILVTKSPSRCPSVEAVKTSRRRRVINQRWWAGQTRWKYVLTALLNKTLNYIIDFYIFCMKLTFSWIDFWTCAPPRTPPPSSVAAPLVVQTRTWSWENTLNVCGLFKGELERRIKKGGSSISVNLNSPILNESQEIGRHQNMINFLRRN